MGNFVKDLRRSRAAVDALVNHYSECGFTVDYLEGKEDQEYGDFYVEGLLNGPEKVNCEVKFDMYAKRSGNLCFEMSNGTKETGIMTTKADMIYYVVPGDGDQLRVFTFEPNKLRKFIQDPANVVMKNGGDKGKFVLALVSIADIMEKDVAEERFYI